MSGRWPAAAAADLDEALASALNAAMAARADAAAAADLEIAFAGAGILGLNGAVVDGVGVRVDGLRWRPSAQAQAPLPARAEQLCGRLAAPLGSALRPVEVDVTLGAAVLRTTEAALRRGRFWQIEVGADGTVEVVRRRVVDGERRAEAFALTREQLGELVEACAASDDGAALTTVTAG